jgi:hypothetical protein
MPVMCLVTCRRKRWSQNGGEKKEFPGVFRDYRLKPVILATQEVQLGRIRV